MFDLFGCSIFSLDSESDWLPESEPLPESLLPDWLLLLEELELEPEPDPDGDPDPEADSSSELLDSPLLLLTLSSSPRPAMLKSKEILSSNNLFHVENWENSNKTVV